MTVDEKPSWTYEEIAKHDKANDCWLVIDDRVYDVTSFVPRHPGGNMIFFNAGRESTKLFEAYHQDHVRKLLPKYFIGHVKGTDTFRVKFADDDQDRARYEKLKQRVMKLFKEKKMHPRFSWQMYIKTAVIVIGLYLSIYMTYYYFHDFRMALLSSVMIGFWLAEVGISIQHDANHGGFHPSAAVNKWAGTSLDFLAGASSFIWKQQHVFGHHTYTNIDGIDPDIRVADPDVRRITHEQPWYSFHRYQHLYAGFLYGLLAIKSIFVDDPKMLLTGTTGKIHIAHCHWEEWIVFWGGKALFVVLHYVLPLLYSHHSFGNLVQLWLVNMFIAGWVLAFQFQVNHVTEGCDFYEKDENDNVPVSWLKNQIEGTSDWAHGSWFWTNVSGGLNYQAVHHLFPWVCHMHYPMIAPIVKQFCKEEGIRYVLYPTFLSAVQAHFTHIKNIGNKINVR